MTQPSLAANLVLLLRGLLLSVALVFSPHVDAAGSNGISIVEASLTEGDDGWIVNAQFDMSLTPELDLALERGLSLYFIAEFDVARPRWYWFDEHPIGTSTTFRLSYHALTRQYRLSTGNLQLGFTTLAEALGVMTRVRDWHVADRGALHSGETYTASLRMRLDTGELPKPFQLNAMTSRDWNLESEWRRFPVEVPR